MKHLKLFLAFGCGWATVIVLGFVADALAQRTTPLQTRIDALADRVKKLELKVTNGTFSRQVAAPFEVVNRAGQRIFYVSSDRDVEYYRGGKRAAIMSAGGGIGTFWVMTSSSKSWATLTAERLAVNEDGKVRMELGRSADKGNYRLIFTSAGGLSIAGIGESTDNNAGVALVNDTSGNTKARVSVTKAGSGAVDIIGDKDLIARLTEGERKGGYLMICSATGCDPPMVDAGDAGGFGVVRTGPLFRNAGPTGAPGSFIEGKH